MSMTAWCDGAFRSAGSITVPVLSHSVGRGSALFEVLDLVDADDGVAVFRLDEHIRRFFAGAVSLDMPLPLSHEELRRAVLETARRSGLRSGAVKFLAWYGGQELCLFPRDPKVSVAVFCMDMVTGLGRTYEQAKQPQSAAISPVRKLSPAMVDVHTKVAANYVNSFYAKRAVVREGYDEAILLDPDGFVTEGPLCNFFVVRDGALLTAPLSKVLGGITRDSVLRVAQRMGIDCRERDYTVDEVRAADEAFFTGSLIRVQPVGAIDRTPLGAQSPGPVTRRLQEGLDDAYAGRVMELRNWLTFL